jgi:hypothetical protein
MKQAIIDIPGIGPAAVAALGEHRIRSLASLAKASVAKISAVPGFSEARATRVIAAANELLAGSGTPRSARGKTLTTDKKVKPGGKGKSKDKGKDKAKGKGKGKDKGKGKGKGKGKNKGRK